VEPHDRPHAAARPAEPSPRALSDEDSLDVAGLKRGDSVGLQVRAVDAVGNVSGVASVAVEVVERDEDSAVTQIAAEAYVEEFGGDLETARRWMQTQDLAANVDNGDLGDAVSDASPAHYGGIWFDNARRRMVVDLTAGASQAAVEDVIAARGLASVTDYRTTDFTQRELELAQPPLEDELADLVDAGLVGLARVSSRNAIEIEVASGATAAQRARVDAAAATAPVRVLVSEVAGPTLGDEELRCRFPDCDLPLRGGVRIVGLQSRDCTAGFPARSRTDAKMYLMTAAHCMTDGTTGWVILETSGLRIGTGINHSVIGPRYGGDVGLIAIADRILPDVRPWVFVTKSKTAGPVQTTRNPRYRITGSSRNREGAYVCFNGRTSGARCGEIKRVNTTFNHRTNMVRVAACSNPGDSGAPFFKGGRAFGILSGHRPGIFGKCSGVYYTGARIAEDFLNVTISG
jgi:streptogrisin C